MELNVEGYKVKLTNLEKIFWPEFNISKGDMINYYINIYPYLAGYLNNRPLSLKIYPDGIHGKSFYRKNCPDYAPNWLSTQELTGSSSRINWIMVNKLADLVWIANQGSIELHGWFSTLTAPLNPDFAVFDLDPGPKTKFRDLIEISLLLKKILKELGLVPFVKTSGQRGLHIYIPLQKKYSYSEVKKFLKTIAELIISLKPELITLEWRKEKRRGRLYIDYRQNGRGKTLPAPYSLRPTPGCTVSTPLNWPEVNNNLTPEKFTINTIRERFQTVDPWNNLLQKRQELPPLAKIPRLLTHLCFFLFSFFCDLYTGF